MYSVTSLFVVEGLICNVSTRIPSNLIALATSNALVLGVLPQVYDPLVPCDVGTPSVTNKMKEGTSSTLSHLFGSHTGPQGPSPNSILEGVKEKVHIYHDICQM